MFKFSITKLYVVLLFSFITRVIIIYFFGDAQIDKEWGAMLHNLEHNQILSSRSINGVPVPNLFMPPLYAWFLFSIKFLINDLNLFLNITFIIQLLLSIISIFLMFLICLNFFDKKISLIGATIYAFFPLNIYAVSQISSIALQMFLINLFLLFFIRFYKDSKKINIIFFSIASSLLILLRGEFYIFVIFSLVFVLFKKKKLNKILLSSLLIILMISPYLYRNYNIFNVITITKSSGFNLLKGNNPKSKVEGVGLFGDVEGVVPEVRVELEKLYAQGPIIKHDLEKDKILLDQAITFIKENPKKYLSLYVQKFTSFFFIDINSTYPNYYSLPHILPKLILSISTLIGIILIFSFKINLLNYLIIFYLSNIALFSVFFILPRYSLILLPLQLIISIEGIRILVRKLTN
tara:strand:+ start:1443 stop:2663 length:1221 start_codon:yes stop_codon:yes gene_type:complete